MPSVFARLADRFNKYRVAPDDCLSPFSKTVVSSRYLWARFVSEAVCATDSSGQILYVNSAFEELFAVSSGSFLHVVSEGRQVDVRAALEDSVHSPVELTRCACLTVIDGRVKPTLLDWAFCSGDACNGEVVLIGRRSAAFFRAVEGSIEKLVDTAWASLVSRVGQGSATRKNTLLIQNCSTIDQSFEAVYMNSKEEPKKTSLIMNSAFTRNVMHQLRSPLSCITFGLGTSSVEELSLSCAAMNDTLNNIALHDNSLRPSRRESCVSFNALILLVEVVDGLAAHARLSEVDLLLDDCIDAEVRVLMNACRTRQALRNVIVDAIKFTPRGGVTSVCASLHGDVFRVEISNSGRTIDAEALVASTFTHFDPSVLEGPHGSSLGMHVARQVVESQGGRFGAYSTPEPPATTFFLELLLSKKEAPRQALHRMGRSILNSKTISVLVVDDSPLCRKLIIRKLASQCESITEANNGLEAYDLVCASLQSGQPYDLIFMDNSMPVMSGVESIRLIRKAGFTGKIVMVTGNALAEDVEEASSAGANDVLIKPLNLDAFDYIDY